MLKHHHKFTNNIFSVDIGLNDCLLFFFSISIYRHKWMMFASVFFYAFLCSWKWNPKMCWCASSIHVLFLIISKNNVCFCIKMQNDIVEYGYFGKQFQWLFSKLSPFHYFNMTVGRWSENIIKMWYKIRNFNYYCWTFLLPTPSTSSSYLLDSNF